jgi:hypothetical protein
MIVDWPSTFGRQMDRYEEEADGGNERSAQILAKLLYELTLLEALDTPPVEDTMEIRRVRQSARYPVWRVSHEFSEDLAVRVICWFPPDEDTVVVALFTGEKASMGDVFYDSAGRRADDLIDIWIRESKE